MNTYHVKQGRNIKLKGSAIKDIVDFKVPAKVAIIPPSFSNAKFRVLVKPNDTVKVGTPILELKTNTDVKVVSPASGKVDAIYRGKKRSLMQVVIKTDKKQTAESFKSHTDAQIKKLSKENILTQLLEGGVWPCIRQRPFSRIADPVVVPKSIFVKAMNTDPLALDIDFILEEQEEAFQTGIDILSKLTDGDVNVCFSSSASSSTLLEVRNAKAHAFAGPHPAGNVSTHIHHVDPINKGDAVWYLDAQDVLRIARLFLDGAYSSETIVALTGEGVSNRVYAATIQGAPISYLIDEVEGGSYRYISGSVLSGTDIGQDGYLGFYDTQVTVIPEGGDRVLFGWLVPGFAKYTFSNTYISAFLGKKDVSLDCDENGSHRAIVLNNLYDKYNALDIMTYFLLRAIIAGDIEEAEKLGLLECDEEDFALATFACPSKTDVGGIIREGLDAVERDG